MALFLRSLMQDRGVFSFPLKYLLTFLKQTVTIPLLLTTYTTCGKVHVHYQFVLMSRDASVSSFEAADRGHAAVRNPHCYTNREVSVPYIWFM
jgi:hypothetical protein